MEENNGGGLASAVLGTYGNYDGKRLHEMPNVKRDGGFHVILVGMEICFK